MRNFTKLLARSLFTRAPLRLPQPALVARPKFYFAATTPNNLTATFAKIR